MPENASARPGDYSKSGYDQGHQAPAADFKGSKELLEDTFFLSNSVPQVGAGFNRHIWQELEEHIQNLVRERQAQRALCHHGAGLSDRADRS